MNNERLIIRELKDRFRRLKNLRENWFDLSWEYDPLWVFVKIAEQRFK